MTIYHAALLSARHRVLWALGIEQEQDLGTVHRSLHSAREWAGREQAISKTNTHMHARRC